MGLIVIILFAMALVGSAAAALAYWRRAEVRRSQLSNERVRHMAASFKRAHED